MAKYILFKESRFSFKMNLVKLHFYQFFKLHHFSTFSNPMNAAASPWENVNDRVALFYDEAMWTVFHSFCILVYTLEVWEQI